METHHTYSSANEDDRCTNQEVKKGYRLEKCIDVVKSVNKTCINESRFTVKSKDLIQDNESCSPGINSSNLGPLDHRLDFSNKAKRLRAIGEKTLNDSRLKSWNHTNGEYFDQDINGSGASIRRDSRLSGLKRNRRATPSPRSLDRKPKKIRRSRTWWLISADNHMKVLWDIMTAIISLCSIAHTNLAIQTKSYDQSLFVMFCECWFFVDICLNFVTEYKTIDGDVICDGKAVWARYLTTWFPIDVLSLIPWERQFVKPIVDMQRKRGFFKKSFFRTKAVLRVARKIRGKHFRLFGKVANNSKHAGVGGRKLLTYSIKYLPKYVLFYKNMKGVLAVRALRQFHWVEKVLKSLCVRRKYHNPEEQLEEAESESERTTHKTLSQTSRFELKRLSRVMEPQIESKHLEDEEDFGLGVY